MTAPPRPPVQEWEGPSRPASPARPKGSIGAKLLFWGGISLMFVAALALVGDWAARNFEMSRLLAVIEKSEDQMRVAQETVLAVDLPPEATEEQIGEASQQLRAAAAAGRDGVARAGEEVGAVTFLPWHSEMLSAQAAYRAHNQAWVEYLSDGASDPQTMFDSDDNIEPTWRRAEFEVREAVPLLPWPGMSARVDRIFTDEEPAGSGPSVSV